MRRAASTCSTGISVRVVSMPSWELFAAQSDDYREQVLPADVPTLAVEAGIHASGGSATPTTSWVSTTSARRRPADRCLREFGFTAENVAARARALLENGDTS